MLTLLRLAARLEEPAELSDSGFLTVALFSGTGLAFALIAASIGVQGVWL